MKLINNEKVEDLVSLSIYCTGGNLSVLTILEAGHKVKEYN